MRKNLELMKNIYVVQDYHTPRMHGSQSRNSKKSSKYMLEKGFESFSRSLRGSNPSSVGFSSRRSPKSGLYSKRSTHNSKSERIFKTVNLKPGKGGSSGSSKGSR